MIFKIVIVCIGAAALLNLIAQKLKDATASVSADAVYDGERQEIELKFQLTGFLLRASLDFISVDRTLAEQIGASAPEGFKETVEDPPTKQEHVLDYVADHPEAEPADATVQRDMAEEYEKELKEIQSDALQSIMWTGSVKLSRFTPTFVRLNVRKKPTSPIRFIYGYEYRTQELLGGHETGGSGHVDCLVSQLV